MQGRHLVRHPRSAMALRRWMHGSLCAELHAGPPARLCVRDTWKNSHVLEKTRLLCCKLLVDITDLENREKEEKGEGRKGKKSNKEKKTPLCLL